MTEENTGTKEKRSEFDMSSCMAMMEKLMSEHGEECDCAHMMSQVAEREEIPDERLNVMSQLKIARQLATSVWTQAKM